MKRYVVILILIVTALLTTVAYHLFKPDWVIFRKGEGYFAKKEYSQAIPLYQAFLQEQPDNTSVRILLARALTWSDHFEEAIVEYKKALGEEK